MFKEPLLYLVVVLAIAFVVVVTLALWWPI
jgi:hypothetical protein